MLPAESRLRRRAEFALAVRRGRRAARGSVVVHLVTDGSGGSQPRVGFVVGRGVGNAVVRNRVRRRLRHLLSDRVPQLPAASLLVVRATPVASERSGAQLAVDVDDALESVTR